MKSEIFDFIKELAKLKLPNGKTKLPAELIIDKMGKSIKLSIEIKNEAEKN